MPKTYRKGGSSIAGKPRIVSYPVGIVPSGDDTPDRPALTAKKPDWVAYAAALGLDTSGTKADIVARVDGA